MFVFVSELLFPRVSLRMLAYVTYHFVCLVFFVDVCGTR